MKDLNTHNGKTKYHYKTISDIHKLWSDTGVYEVAYIELVQTKNILIKNKKLIELLIDSTLIINRSGVECIRYGTQDRKKKFTKLTARDVKKLFLMQFLIGLKIVFNLSFKFYTTIQAIIKIKKYK